MKRRSFLKSLMTAAAAIMMPLSLTEFGALTTSVEEPTAHVCTLLCYEMPIIKIIESQSIKDIQEIEDKEFLRHIEEAVRRRT